jgi:hypothetical protein
MKSFFILCSGAVILCWGLYMCAKPVYLKITGVSVTGIVTGFKSLKTGSKNKSALFFKPGHKPKIKFLPPQQKDSIAFFASGGGFFGDQYELGEKVTVVYNSKNILQHAVFNITEMSSGLLIVLLGGILLLVMLKPVKNKQP